MTASGRWFITPHAVERFIELTGGGMSYEGALTRLISASQTADLRKQLDSGALLYVHRGTGPRWRFIVAVPSEEGLLPQLITVRPPHDGWQPPAQPGNAREEQPARRRRRMMERQSDPVPPREPERKPRLVEVITVRRIYERG